MNFLLPVALSILAVVTVNGCPSNIDYDAVYDLQGSNTLDPDITQHVAFYGEGCSKRGVLKINLGNPGTARGRILIDMEFSSPSRWTFNLGGSPTNDGYAGDYGSTIYDAEIHAHSTGIQTLRGYYSDVGGSGQAFSYPSFFSTRLTLIIGNNNIVFLPDANDKFNYFDKSGMFNLAANNVLYLGINRSIYRSSRIGTGLCKVSFKFLHEL